MKKLFAIVLSVFLTFSVKAQLWDSLRGGLGNPPRAMYADTLDNYLYAAGIFNLADGIHCKGIARWNGVQWDSLGAGIDGLDTLNSFPQNTLAITRYNNEIYAGGVFSSAGNLGARRLARWNGTQWDSLPVQPFIRLAVSTGSSISALEVFNGSLYVGGCFDTIRNTFCKGFASWNGSNWNCIGLPTNITSPVYVNAICSYNNEIYAAGLFHSTLNDSISNILRWNGTSWRSVGGGVKGSWTGIESMVVYNGELYVAGAFFQADGNASDNIQKWNGTSWSDVGGGTGGTNGQIHHLMVYHNKLYAMGVFDFAGGVPANYFASWDGTNWCGVGSTFDNILISGCVYNDSIYVGGGFWTIDGDSISRIAKCLDENYSDSCGNTTGIKENVSSEIISVFPNPASDVIVFQTKNSIDELIITDQLGKEIHRQKINGERQIEILVSDLANGMYFYQVVGKDNINSSGKFIVQH